MKPGIFRQHKEIKEKVISYKIKKRLFSKVLYHPMGLTKKSQNPLMEHWVSLNKKHVPLMTQLRTAQNFSV